jgi:sarcosine oxidase subunit beta
MQTADAVIIGAGVNGASIAYNLVKRGLKKVVLLERYLIASGGTGRSAALVRQHYSNEALVRMVRRSVEIFHNFSHQIGGESGFINSGWAFLVPEYVSEGFSRNLAMQRALGVRTLEISTEELKSMEPRFDLSDVHRIAYEPDSGYADPQKTTLAYVQRFREMGGEVIQMTPVQRLVVENEKVKTVRTERLDISTNLVINAAGPWSHVIAGLVGLDIPIEVTLEEEVIIESGFFGGPPKIPCSDMAKAIYYRPDGDRTLLGRGFPKNYEQADPDHYREAVGEGFMEEALRLFGERFPPSKNALIGGARTGLYDVTPDWNPILGKADGLMGFYLCCGFSGHGFKLGPAIGELMAEEILDGKAHSIDISPFHISRFERGELLKAAYGGNRA